MTRHIAFFTAIHFIHAVGNKNSNAKSCQLFLVRTVSTRIVHPGSNGCFSFPAGFAAMLTQARGSKSAMWNVTSTSIATIPLCGFFFDQQRIDAHKQLGVHDREGVKKEITSQVQTRMR